MGVYLGAGRSEFINFSRAGAGARTLALARTMGIDCDAPALVIPLMMAQEQARREDDLRLVSGFAYVVASSFGKASMADWMDSLYPPAHILEQKKAKEERDQEMRARAMAVRLQMMADRYEITEVRE